MADWFCSGSKKTVGASLGSFKVAQAVALMLVSLVGLVLEPTLDKEAGCGACSLDRMRPPLQASWCSMKLSTLQ